MARTHQGPPIVRFYQLANLSWEAALVGIVGKAWDRGLRLCLLAKDGQQAHWLDQLLWTTPLHPFLPHGLWNSPDPALHPILISLEPDERNQATLLLLATPSVVANPASFDLLIDFVPGMDPAILAASRTRYRHYRTLGCTMEYWTQHPNGGWKKQETQKRREEGVPTG